MVVSVGLAGDSWNTARSEQLVIAGITMEVEVKMLSGYNPNSTDVLYTTITNKTLV